jgi:HSP20 family molecular chaperone IbpA
MKENVDVADVRLVDGILSVELEVRKLKKEEVKRLEIK